MRKGSKHTEDSKKRMSETRKELFKLGLVKSPNSPIKISSDKKVELLEVKRRREKSWETRLKQSLSLRGEKHPMWRGKWASHLPHLMEWKEWRRIVLERDVRTCRVCHYDGENLVAHHIIPIEVDINKIYDISNGVTLCRACHGWLHNIALFVKKAENSGELQLLFRLLKILLDNPEPSQKGDLLEGATTKGREFINSVIAHTKSAPERDDIV